MPRRKLPPPWNWVRHGATAELLAWRKRGEIGAIVVSGTGMRVDADTSYSQLYPGLARISGIIPKFRLVKGNSTNPYVPPQDWYLRPRSLFDHYGLDEEERAEVVFILGVLKEECGLRYDLDYSPPPMNR